MIKDTATSTHMIKPATAIFIRQSLLQFRIVDFVSQPSCDNAMMETMKESVPPYSFSYPHLFISPTVQQPVSMQASYRLWQTGCFPQSDRACEQVARCWASAS